MDTSSANQLPSELCLKSLHWIASRSVKSCARTGPGPIDHAMISRMGKRLAALLNILFLHYPGLEQQSADRSSAQEGTTLKFKRGSGDGTGRRECQMPTIKKITASPSWTGRHDESLGRPTASVRRASSRPSIEPRRCRRGF